MTQQEHLLLIRAKCVELLELAKQRTPGRWSVSFSETSGRPLIRDKWNDRVVGSYRNSKDDAAFIASAAGPFEAALASTVAAIDNFMLIHEQTDLGEYAAWDALQEIIQHWPLELLQQ